MLPGAQEYYVGIQNDGFIRNSQDALRVQPPRQRCLPRNPKPSTLTKSIYRGSVGLPPRVLSLSPSLLLSLSRDSLLLYRWNAADNSLGVELRC